MGSGWIGHSYTSTDLTPPDVEVAAGPTDIVETVNSRLVVYSRQGVLAASYDLPTFFLAPSDYVTDPQVRYDAFSGRWFVTVTDGTFGEVLLAVSQSGDPTGSWRYYATGNTTNCPDQPLLGVGAVNLIFTMNWFSNPCSSSNYTYLGAQVYVVNKTQLVQGSTSAQAWVSSLNVNDYSIHPVKMEGAGPDYMVSVYWPGTAVTSTVMQLFTVTGSPPGTVTVSEVDLSMPLASVPVGAREAGTTYALDPGDIRVADAAWSAGHLWLAFEEACSVGGNVPGPCIRFMEIDTSTASIVQDFDLGSSSRAYFYPALAIDGSGNLAVVFGYSSPYEYPGILVTGRLASDPAGYLQPPVLVKAGTGAEATWCPSGTCRYGDYFGASLDPTAPSTVWLAGEFGQGVAGWGTYIVSARVKALLTIGFNLQVGTPPASGPALHYVLDGVASSAVVAPGGTSVAADPGSPWSIDANFSAPSGLARYVILPSEASLLTGTATQSTTEILTYQAQYFVLVTADSPLASALVTGGGWYPAGSLASISASSNASWRFSGWIGVGNGSYSGPLAAANMTVTEPLLEVAILEPALVITSGAGGSVTYSSATATGTVPSGTTVTIYVPLGSTVNLTAQPGSFLNVFASWSGASTSGAASVSVKMTAPTSIASAFGLNLLPVVGIIAAIAATAIVVVFLVRRRRRKPAAPPQGPTPSTAPPPASLSVPPAPPPAPPPQAPPPPGP